MIVIIIDNSHLVKYVDAGENSVKKIGRIEWGLTDSESVKCVLTDKYHMI